MAQIGTVRLETQNSGVVDVPVFEPGDSASGIYEFVRVETASGPGFIAVTDPADATYPYLRVQSQNNGIVAVTDTPGSDIPDSGVSRYTFDNSDTSTGTAINIWGSNDASINGATTGVSGANQTYNTNEAYDFDGNDDTVEGTNFFSLSSYSVSLWLNFDAFNSSGDNYIFHIGDGAGDYQPLIDNNSGAYSVTHQGNTVSTGTVQTNTWVFLTVTFDGSTLKLYENGSLLGSTAASGSFTDKNLSVGTIYGFGSDHYDGQVDDIRIYNKALSGTEVSNLYNTGSI